MEDPRKPVDGTGSMGRPACAECTESRGIMTNQAFRGSLLTATLVVASLLGGMPDDARANGVTPDGMASFLTRADDLHREYAYGFDGNDPDLAGTPDWVISPDATWYDVRRAGFDPGLPEPELVVTVDQCLLLNGTGSCQDRIDPGKAYSGILTVSFETPAAAPNSGFLLLVSGLNYETAAGTTPPDPFYPESEVRMILEPQGQAPLQTIMWTSPSGTVTHYLGFRIDTLPPGQPQSVTFVYDAAAMAEGSKAPVFRSNVIYEFVPEPGTGLLFGLGLAGLGLLRRR